MVSSLAPQASASANSATPALKDPVEDQELGDEDRRASAEREHALVTNALERRTLEVESAAAALASNGVSAAEIAQAPSQVDTVFVVNPAGERLESWARDASAPQWPA